ncbi:MAG: response regulator [Acidaminococcaceae bacterium]
MASILIVDDNEQISELAKDVMESWGHTAWITAEGRSGVELALAKAPDIILLDVMLPGLSGYEVCRALRANPVTQNIPVIMMSALTDSEDRIHGYKVGADNFLVKPINYEELRAIINKLLADKILRDTMEPLTGVATIFYQLLLQLEPEAAQKVKIEEDYYTKLIEVMGMAPKLNAKMAAIATFRQVSVSTVVKNVEQILSTLHIWPWLVAIDTYTKQAKGGVQPELLEQLQHYRVTEEADLVLIIERFVFLLMEQKGNQLVAISLLKLENGLYHFNEGMLKKLEQLINDEKMLLSLQ